MREGGLTFSEGGSLHYPEAHWNIMFVGLFIVILEQKLYIKLS